ncbi:hypothetical protein FGB62_52g03 [Gracilaria domingensis]|nr:hypothetical protein FGB62_52g03 [Gracilaria domingensis]
MNILKVLLISILSVCSVSAENEELPSLYRQFSTFPFFGANCKSKGCGIVQGPFGPVFFGGACKSKGCPIPPGVNVPGVPTTPLPPAPPVCCTPDGCLNGYRTECIVGALNPRLAAQGYFVASGACSGPPTRFDCRRAEIVCSGNRARCIFNRCPPPPRPAMPRPRPMQPRPCKGKKHCAYVDRQLVEDEGVAHDLGPKVDTEHPYFQLIDRMINLSYSGHAESLGSDVARQLKFKGGFPSCKSKGCPFGVFPGAFQGAAVVPLRAEQLTEQPKCKMVAFSCVRRRVFYSKVSFRLGEARAGGQRGGGERGGAPREQRVAAGARAARHRPREEHVAHAGGAAGQRVHQAAVARAVRAAARARAHHRAAGARRVQRAARRGERGGGAAPLAARHAQRRQQLQQQQRLRRALGAADARRARVARAQPVGARAHQRPRRHAQRRQRHVQRVGAPQVHAERARHHALEPHNHRKARPHRGRVRRRDQVELLVAEYVAQSQRFTWLHSRVVRPFAAAQNARCLLCRVAQTPVGVPSLRRLSQQQRNRERQQHGDDAHHADGGDRASQRGRQPPIRFNASNRTSGAAK